MNNFTLIFKNDVLISAVYSWFIAQFLKIVIELMKKKKFRTKDFFIRALFGTGGMPSSHSATVAAVSVSIGIIEGFQSSIFALSFVIVLIVIRDATGVRFSSGKQAEVINKIIDQQASVSDIHYDKVKEVRGHTPLETFVGALVGLIVSLGINLI